MKITPFRAKFSFFLGFVGLALLTAPFLWLKLRYQSQSGMIEIIPNLQGGLAFIQGLMPVVIGIAVIFFLRKTSAHLPFSCETVKQSTQNAWRHPAAPWVFAALVLLLPFVLEDKALSRATFVGIYMILALGLNITIGMTGLLVLGYSAFFSLGAYAFAVLHKLNPSITWWMTLPLAMGIGAGIGWLVGLPCLRLRGDYLAIVTLGFAESFRELTRNLTSITGGDRGIIISANAKFCSIAGLNGRQIALFAVIIAVILSVLMIHRIYHSPIGRAWRAIRENEIAAAAMGVSVVQMKLLAFALSASLGALAGVLNAAFLGYVDPSAGTFENSVLVLAMVILGGLGSIPGALLGSALLYLIPDLLRDYIPGLSDFRLLLFGGILVGMMLLRPRGLLGEKSE